MTLIHACYMMSEELNREVTHNRSVQADEHAIALELRPVQRIFRSLVGHYWSACSQLTSDTLYNLR